MSDEQRKTSRTTCTFFTLLYFVTWTKITSGHLQNQGPREMSCIFLCSVFKKTVLIFKCTLQYL